MKSFEISLENLLDNVDNYKAELNMDKKQRAFYDMLFMDRIKSLNGQMNLYEIQSAIEHCHFINANKLCYEILPSLNDKYAKEIATLYRFILTYNYFDSSCQSQCLASAMDLTNEYLIKLKALYPQNYGEYIVASIKKDKVGFMKEIMNELGIKVSYDDIECTIEGIDELFTEKELLDTNKIITYNIESYKISEFLSIMSSMGINIVFDPEVENIKNQIDNLER